MHRLFQGNQILKTSIYHSAIIFYQSASFNEQIRQKIFFSEIDSDHKLVIKVTTQVTTCVTYCF